MKRPALQTKRVGVLRIAFRARKVFGSFEKRTPGLILRELSSIHMQTFSFVSVEKYGSWSREWKPALIFYA